MLSGMNGWLKQSVLLWANQGFNSEGRPTYTGGGTTTACYIQARRQEYISKEGNESVETATVIVDGGVTVDEYSKIQFADGQTPNILGVQIFYAPDGSVMYKGINTNFSILRYV